MRADGEGRGHGQEVVRGVTTHQGLRAGLSALVGPLQPRGHIGGVGALHPCEVRRDADLADLHALQTEHGHVNRRHHLRAVNRRLAAHPGLAGHRAPPACARRLRDARGVPRGHAHPHVVGINAGLLHLGHLHAEVAAAALTCRILDDDAVLQAAGCLGGHRLLHGVGLRGGHRGLQQRRRVLLRHGGGRGDAGGEEGCKGDAAEIHGVASGGCWRSEDVRRCRQRTRAPSGNEGAHGVP